MNRTELRCEIAALVVAGKVTASRKVSPRAAKDVLLTVHPVGVPDRRTRAGIRSLIKLGLAELTAREHLPLYTHYRVDPTVEGVRVFRTWGIHID